MYGGYTSFAYFTPILGGLIADRYLGRRRAVILGGSIMAIGHFLMALPAMFYPALATIAIGNGFFLPSLPSQVRYLYAPGDPRGDSAFSVYYVGINLGAVLAPLICGTLGELYGWHYGFAAAGVGMCLGLAIYVWGGRYLPREAGRVEAWEPATHGHQHSFARRVGLLVGVIAIVVVFRGAYEQIGNTVALWADSAVDRSANLGWTIPSTWFQALNPLLVFTVTPLLLLFWAQRGRTAHTAYPLRRMAVGALIVAASYCCLRWLRRIRRPREPRRTGCGSLRSSSSSRRANCSSCPPGCTVRPTGAGRAGRHHDGTVVLGELCRKPARGRARILLDAARRHAFLPDDRGGRRLRGAALAGGGWSGAPHARPTH